MTNAPSFNAIRLTEVYDVNPSVVGRVYALLNREGLPANPDHVAQVLALHSRRGLNLELRKALSVSLLLRAVTTCGMQAHLLSHPAQLDMVIDLGRTIARHPEALSRYDLSAELLAVIELARSTDLPLASDEPENHVDLEASGASSRPTTDVPPVDSSAHSWCDDISTDSPLRADPTLHVSLWTEVDTPPDPSEFAAFISPVHAGTPTINLPADAESTTTLDSETPARPLTVPGELSFSSGVGEHLEPSRLLTGIPVDDATVHTAFPDVATPMTETATEATPQGETGFRLAIHPAFLKSGAVITSASVLRMLVWPDCTVPYIPMVASSPAVLHGGEQGGASEDRPVGFEDDALRTRDASVVAQMVNAVTSEPNGQGVSDVLPWVAESREATIEEISAHLAENQNLDGVLVCLEALQPYRVYLVKLEVYYLTYPELRAGADFSELREVARVTQDILLILEDFSAEDFAVLAPEARMILEPASRLLA